MQRAEVTEGVLHTHLAEVIIITIAIIVIITITITITIIKSTLEVAKNSAFVILVVALVPVLILIITGNLICVLVHISCMSTLLCTCDSFGPSLVTLLALLLKFFLVNCNK